MYISYYILKEQSKILLFFIYRLEKSHYFVKRLSKHMFPLKKDKTNVFISDKI